MMDLERQYDDHESSSNPKPMVVDTHRTLSLEEEVLVVAEEAWQAVTPGSKNLLKRFRANARRIHKTCQKLIELSRSERQLPSASEWILDNRYIIEEVIRGVKTDLPTGYYKELPAISDGTPRVYSLAAMLVKRANSNLREDQLREVLHTYQTITPLKIGELWALPIMFRLALIENLRLLADDILEHVCHTESAKETLDLVARGVMPRLPVDPSDIFTISLWEGVRDQELVEGPALEAVREWGGDRFAEIAESQHVEFCRQAAAQVSIGNAITSLRLLGIIDWGKFFEAISLVEETLRQDRVHATQDTKTRDECRRVVEGLARLSKCTELEVASRSVRLGKSELDRPAAWYLIGDGRPKLERILGLTPLSSFFQKGWASRYPYTVYFGLFSLYLLTIILLPILTLGLTTQLTAIVVLLFVLPASEISHALVNFSIARLVLPRVPARIDVREGIPKGCDTFVVVPTMISRPGQAAHLIEKLEQHYLANPDQRLYFALLTDFPDAPEEHMPNDESCTAALSGEIAALNVKYATNDQPRFFVFHRGRQFNPSENRWMAWERKRGKLEEFNRLLRGATDHSFVYQSSDISSLPHFRFVLTLDTDTVLPRDAAKHLIAILAHPNNKPIYSEDARTVIAGYTLVQPRVSFLYRTSFRSWFTRFYAGSAGIDPYSAAVSDTYMDLFGRGTFTGKGLYDIDAFTATSGRAFPDNRILSHDLIESNYSRCALASDVEVFDEFPARYHAYSKRDYRWIRGDWQLLPWLSRTVPTTEGSLANPLDTLSRWKILDNLRRSVVPGGMLVLLILGWTILPGSPLLWTLFALAPFLMPTLLFAFESGVSVLFGVTIRAIYARAKTDLQATLGQAILQIGFLVNHSLIALDAIVRTLYRIAFTKKNLLEWESAAAADNRLKDGLADFFIFMAPTTIFTIVTIAIVSYFNLNALPVAGAVLFLWLVSPLTAWFVSRNREMKIEALTDVQRAELLRIGRKTWIFFERFVGPEDNGLPPDNFQEKPLGAIAHRTSPTNIGLYLVSVVAAKNLGFIQSKDVIERIGRAFEALDKLMRHRGHFLNWYETDTLRPLRPAYVSTVDSGNFRACLLVLRHALEDLAVEEEVDSEAFRSLADRSNKFAIQMDFRFLYNGERDLFTIGFNVDANKADANHYDLLASEACIASFLAVAFGEAPRKHWFQLGRLLTSVSGQAALVSWGGTMFEYLMPRILLPVPPGVLLDRAQDSAVARQIEYGLETGIPWGISESGYYAFDAAQVYQYLSFGVPGLGLKRGLEKDRVIAPYATLMAIDIRPTEALRNLQRISSVGGEGTYGYYEALDYSVERLPAGSTHMVVSSYMAHHQGMGLLAIYNRLTDGRIREWLRREPAVRAAELLLEERVPSDAPLIEVLAPEPDARRLIEPEFPSRRRITTADTPTPRVQLISNGHFTSLATNAGGGFIRFRDLDVTRWRSDPTCDSAGLFIYLRDRRNGEVWSSTHHPTRRYAEEYEVFYALDKIDYRRVDKGIETLTEVTVAPDRNVELRRVTLTNLGKLIRELELTSYLEVVLLPAASDIAHPAFGKLFLETDWLYQQKALLCRRRTRSPEEKSMFAFHSLACESPERITFETDREVFLGRRRTTADPVAMESNYRELKGNVGPVLDPIFALRLPVRIKPGEKVTIAFITGVADSRDEAQSILEHYRDLGNVNRGFEMAWAHSMIEMKHARLRPDDVHLFQRLAGFLLYPTTRGRAPSDVLAANQRGQSGLWAFGISGDLPICLLRVHGPAGLAHLRQLLQAHAYWRSKDFKIDLVILCENAGGYYDEAFDEVLSTVRSMGMGDLLDKPAGVFIRKRIQMDDAERILLLSASSLILDDQAGPLGAQVNGMTEHRIPTQPPSANTRKPRFQSLPPAEDTFADNGFGAFVKGGAEYKIEPNKGDQIPPAPWSNVIANPNAGMVVTDSGGGFTWVGNSQRNRLTPWSNDPVSDPIGEAIYITDRKQQLSWNPTPLPIRDGSQTRVRHGQGYTTFERIVEDIHHELTIGLAETMPVKMSLLRLKNDGHEPVELSVVYYVECTLGTHRTFTAPHIVSSFDATTNTLLARNAFNPEASGAVMFACASLGNIEYTGDRREFIGRNGTLTAPEALLTKRWSNHTDAGLDPCIALRGNITLDPGETQEIVFLLGEGRDEAHALQLAQSLRTTQAARAEFDHSVAKWRLITSAVRVKTPDPTFDALINHWLIYQTLSCRYWGRSAFQQSGGAYGFRDQLQDVMALLYATPELTKEHILRAAEHQFVEGDVQHWWHPGRGDGVRTRFSDDFLWLPLTVMRYIEVTGDHAILDEQVRFVEGSPLPADKHEVYETTRPSDAVASLYSHCIRAMEHGWKLGVHGLPLMGCGDWNDGMNRVGIEGRGESIFVAWFQIYIKEQFADLAESCGDSLHAGQYRERAAKLREATEKFAYDGQYYLRAFTDDGGRLGADGNRECAIDSLTQSWAVIAKGADRNRLESAMNAVMERLVRQQERLVILFDPPFDAGSFEPGYIKGYVPGTRENGGQYTHAACWVVQALTMLGRGDDAYKLFNILNPAKSDPIRYRGEPYVIAADVYSNPRYPGRAGWTWYTGSSSWMYRAGLESILGMRREGNRFYFEPVLPKEWNEFQIDYRFGRDTIYSIHVRVTLNEKSLTLDGRLIDSGILTLVEDGRNHEVTVMVVR
jgi:cyclic beta-1,2-glucan synthetase